MSENSIVAPVRLRAEPPRITRLSPKVIVGVGVVASLDIGGALERFPD